MLRGSRSKVGRMMRRVRKQMMSGSSGQVSTAGSVEAGSVAGAGSGAGKAVAGAAAAVAAAVAYVGISESANVFASDDSVHPQHFNWDHKGVTKSFNTAALRRGFEVYRQVCSTCHSLSFIAFRNLVGVTHTEEQAKTMALAYEVTDGPNDQGEMFKRPGKLSDSFPSPYANEEAAKAANNGAYPPDLSLVSKARMGGEDYVFALLTGYMDPPAGIKAGPGQYYNPYFSGGFLAMPAPLMDEQVEYQDGTVATVSQEARDVATFLAWASEPETDQRKKAGLKFVTALITAAVLSGLYKRFRWNVLKSKKLRFL